MAESGNNVHIVTRSPWTRGSGAWGKARGAGLEGAPGSQGEGGGRPAGGSDKEKGGARRAWVDSRPVVPRACAGAETVLGEREVETLSVAWVRSVTWPGQKAGRCCA